MTEDFICECCGHNMIDVEGSFVCQGCGKIE